MAEDIKLPVLTAAISALSIPVTSALGASVVLRIQDITQTAETPKLGLVDALGTQDLPTLSPKAMGFVTNVAPSLDTEGGDAAYKSIAYDLNYQLFFYPWLEGGSWTAFWGQNATCVMQILLYFMTHTNQFSNQGAETFLPNALPVLAPQADSTGTFYHGAEISFHVMHYLED